MKHATPEEQTAQDIMDQACLSVNYYENGVVAAIQQSIVEALQEAEARVMAKLSDPAAVHVNMVAGKIAKISMEQCAHTHGEEMVARWKRVEGSEALGVEMRQRFVLPEWDVHSDAFVMWCNLCDQRISNDKMDGHAETCLLFAPRRDALSEG